MKGFWIVGIILGVILVSVVLYKLNQRKQKFQNTPVNQAPQNSPTSTTDIPTGR